MSVLKKLQLIGESKYQGRSAQTTSMGEYGCDSTYTVSGFPLQCTHLLADDVSHPRQRHFQRGGIPAELS